VARIRSVKPQLRTSRVVAAWPYAARYAWVLLWGYLDDAGRGVDDTRLLVADLFPLDREINERRMEGFLDLWTRVPLGHADAPLCRYEVDGLRYLHAVNWEEHQRINRPTASQLPPCPVHDHGSVSRPARRDAPARPPLTEPLTESATDSLSEPLTESLTEPTREPLTEPLREGSLRARKEQGEGRREGRIPPRASPSAGRPTAAPPAAAPAPADPDPPPDGAQALVAAWIDRCARRPPSSVVARVGRHLRELLADGVDPADAAAGLAAWHDRRLDPSTLPSVVNEVMQGPRAAPARNGPSRPSTTDARVADALALAARYAAAEHDPPDPPALNGAAP